jgi:hypothetical protein
LYFFLYTCRYFSLYTIYKLEQIFTDFCGSLCGLSISPSCILYIMSGIYKPGKNMEFGHCWYMKSVFCKCTNNDQIPYFCQVYISLTLYIRCMKVKLIVHTRIHCITSSQVKCFLSADYNMIYKCIYHYTVPLIRNMKERLSF